jgi:hypothetical protein
MQPSSSGSAVNAQPHLRLPCDERRASRGRHAFPHRAPTQGSLNRGGAEGGRHGTWPCPRARTRTGQSSDAMSSADGSLARLRLPCDERRASRGRHAFPHRAPTQGSLNRGGPASKGVPPSTCSSFVTWQSEVRLGGSVSPGASEGSKAHHASGGKRCAPTCCGFACHAFEPSLAPGLTDPPSRVLVRPGHAMVVARPAMRVPQAVRGAGRSHADGCGRTNLAFVEDPPRRDGRGVPSGHPGRHLARIRTHRRGQCKPGAAGSRHSLPVDPAGA